MNEINTNHLLSQIRTLGQELQSSQIPSQAPDGGFSDMLKTSIDAVNDIQKQAGDLKVSFENGTTDKSLAEVMIASQKADLSFRAITEVRNKLVTAYQDIMNMPV